MTLSYHLSQDDDWQKQASWQVPDTPFMDFRFWQALKNTQAIGKTSGWLEYYVVIQKSESTDADTAKLVAVMPVFIKNHHRGEFVFDHSWAEAYASYGYNYYPRLVTSAPYSPITGQRIWLAVGQKLTDDILTVVLQGVDALAKQVNASSWHGLYLPSRLLSRLSDSLSSRLSGSLEETQDSMTDSNTEDEACEQTNPSTQTDPSTQTKQHSKKLLQRQGCQFQWFNRKTTNGQPFTDFEDFLSTLTAKKRKNIRQERKKIGKQQLVTRRVLGTELTANDWNVFYQCYAMTYLIRGQRPYLSPEFFVQLGKSMPEQLMMTQAIDMSANSTSRNPTDANNSIDANKPNEFARPNDGKANATNSSINNATNIVACSLFLYDNNSNTIKASKIKITNDDATIDKPEPTSERMLYGRYWGSLAQYDSLHFELCYYQGIEFAIEQGLQIFDPGTQGEHKLVRGFVPTITHSLHKIYDANFHPAIAHFCKQEAAYMAEYRQQAFAALPFNVDNMPKF